MSIDDIKKALIKSADLKAKLAELLPEKIEAVSQALSISIKNGGKAIFCGNGGSAADSQHLATEMVVRLSGQVNRKALAAVSLTVNSSILTACANDYGFDCIFSRQLEALGCKGDILFAISTSGNSQNVINAVAAASSLGIATVGLLGGDGGRLAGMVDFPLVVPSEDVQRIQESHITIGHIMITRLEQILGFTQAK